MKDMFYELKQRSSCKGRKENAWHWSRRKTGISCISLGEEQISIDPGDF